MTFQTVLLILIASVTNNFATRLQVIKSDKTLTFSHKYNLHRTNVNAVFLLLLFFFGGIRG